MSVTPKLCIKYEADASQITITDDTGEYVADFNETGYGTPNAARGDVAGVFLVYYQSYDSDKQELNFLVDYNDAYDNSYKSTLELPYFKDGWYQFNYILVDTSVTAVEGNIFYSTDTESLRQYDSELNAIELFDNTKLLDTQVYPQANLNELSVANLAIKKNTLSKEFFACKQCIECGCKEEMDSVVFLREGLAAAKAQFQISRFEAQKFIEKLTKQYKIK